MSEGFRRLWLVAWALGVAWLALWGLVIFDFDDYRRDPSGIFEILFFFCVVPVGLMFAALWVIEGFFKRKGPQ